MSGEKVKMRDEVKMDDAPQATPENAEPTKETAAGAAGVDAVLRQAATRRSAGAAMRSILVAAGVLLFLNADALERYIAGLGGSMIVEESLILSGQWSALMTELGFSAPREFIRAGVDYIHDLRFYSDSGDAAPWMSEDQSGDFTFDDGDGDADAPSMPALD